VLPGAGSIAVALGGLDAIMMLGVVQAASDNAARLDANTNACF
jgi:hypothetical protein